METQRKPRYRIVLELAIDLEYYTKPESWDWRDVLGMNSKDVRVIEVKEVFDERPA